MIYEYIRVYCVSVASLYFATLRASGVAKQQQVEDRRYHNFGYCSVFGVKSVLMSRTI